MSASQLVRPSAATPSVPSNISAELSQFKGAVTQAGYAEFVASFNPFRFAPAYWEVCRYSAFPYLRSLIDFFMLRLPAAPATLDEILGSSWRVLLKLRLARAVSDTWVYLPRYHLFSYLGHLIFTDAPSNPDPAVYFGDDSIGLLTRLAPHSDSCVLDLCSGSGIIAFQSALYARSVDAVEINPVTRHILKINAAMNGLSEKVTAYGGSIYERIPKRRQYDRVVCNPPLVPCPDEFAYPFIGHGGFNGLAVIKRVLEGLPKHLSESGFAQIIALTFSDGSDLLVHEELSQLARRVSLDIGITIINHIPFLDSELFESFIQTILLRAQQSSQEIRNAFLQSLDRVGMSHLAPYYIFAKKGRGSITYQNLSRAPQPGLWAIG